MWNNDEAELLNVWRKYRSAAQRYEGDDEGFGAWWDTLTEREQFLLQQEIDTQTTVPEA